MTDPAGPAGDYNTTIIEEFRASQGRVGGMWPKLVAEWPKPGVAGSPDLGAAQARTTRQIPVFILTRQD